MKRCNRISVSVTYTDPSRPHQCPYFLNINKPGVEIREHFNLQAGQVGIHDF